MLRRCWRTATFFLSLPAFAVSGSGLIQVTGIHAWTHPGFTRVMFDTTGDFQAHSERAFNPDRIFFDLAHARPWIDGRRYATYPINDTLIRRVRVAETSPGTTRIVFDLNVPAEFKMIRLDHPNRMVIEISPSHSEAVSEASPTVLTRSAGPAPLPYVPNPAPPSASELTGNVAARSGFRYPPVPARPRFVPMPLADNAPALDAPPLLSVYFPDSAYRLPQGRPPKRQASLIARTTAPASSAPAPLAPITISPPAKSSTAAKPSTYDMTPRASLNANRSLTRALGLKINRIVIDAGHGGHDDGTIGPNGVLEKDVVLDVAMRLSQLVQSRMGAEVVLTRSDDTFIPLQERTAIANARKADLFLSIHANSSPAPSVAGTETFFLNFTNSPGALDVAARENAGADKSVGELKDLIQSITLNDKIAESETFAQDIQTALFSQAAKSNVAAKNRGVKRAPFVVLIGAEMPSILAEIGFLSNSRDETNLNKPEYRQKIAEALYRGLSQYAQSLSHFETTASNQPRPN
ncbi:MAG TPA: N-acetylmuramoyl-L-alanine amidase [Bryobacteraceae bacterium]|nr:N-acetylmuramoyl-L-alanine amidase [Bryobacteraceae bacterium]